MSLVKDSIFKNRFIPEASLFQTLVVLIFVICLMFISSIHAAHPLITDDAGTVTPHRLELEFTGDLGYCTRYNGKHRHVEIPVGLTYGLSDKLDVAAALPYYVELGNAANSNRILKGMLDATIELKWRFYEKKGLQLAIKPGFTIPIGDENSELGTGKITFSMFAIGTQQVDNWWFHINAGYIRNENVLGENLHLWHVSAASEMEISGNLRAVANLGFNRSLELQSDQIPGFILGGLIYSLANGIDLDVGIKTCFNEQYPERSLLAGITWLL